MSEKITVKFDQSHKASTEWPRVSVIIPTYNNARYIGQALDSVFSQNYHDYEIIVIDDGSTDDTQQVLAPYRDRIRYVYQENAGSAAARNTGLDMARGEFIVFLDADDLLLPGKLKEQAAFLQLHPNTGMIHSGLRWIDKNGYVITDIEPWHEAPILDLETWLQYKPIFMGAMMFRRLWLESVGGLDSSLRQAQDIDLLLRLALAGCRAEWIYKPTLCARLHSTSTTHKNIHEHSAYHLAVLDKFFSHPNLPKRIISQKSKVYYYSLLSLAWFFYSTGLIHEMQEHLRQALKFSPYDPIHTLFDWLKQFKTWNVRHGQSNNSLDQIWGKMLVILSNDYDSWQDVEKFVRLWWTRYGSQSQWRSIKLNELWPYWQQALSWAIRTPNLKAETYFDWWLNVWSGYLQGRHKQATEALTHFKELQTEGVLELVRYSIAATPETITTALFELFWKDAQRHQLLPQDASAINFLREEPDFRLPKISIIIPAYNSGNYICETIDSVLNQDYRSKEIIVIDDGSTDDTAERLQAYRAQIRYLNQPNQGVSRARNHGLQVALGKYIVFLDSDDTLLPGKLAEQAAQLDQNPQLGGVHSGWRLVTAYGTPIRDIEPWQQAEQLDLISWLRWKPAFLGAMMIRRQRLLQVKGFDEQLRQAEDVDLLLRLALQGCTFEWIRRPTVCYRQHLSSTMQNSVQQAAQLTKVLDKFYALPGLPLQVRQIEPHVRFHSLMWIIWQLFRTNQSGEIANYLRQTLNYVNDPPLLTVQHWLRQLVQYAAHDDVPLSKLKSLWPYFRSAVDMNDREWTATERVMDWWLSYWTVWNGFYDQDQTQIWKYNQALAEFDEEEVGLTQETMMDWWLHVWQPYIDHHRHKGVRSLALFKELSPKQLVNLIQISIVCDPNATSPVQIHQLWQDLQDNGLIPAAEKTAVAGVFLTGFGQAAMGRQWQTARQWLWQALRFGIGRRVIRAWLRFLQRGIQHLGNGSYQRQLNRMGK